MSRTAARLELRAIADHRPVLAGREQNRTGQDRTGLNPNGVRRTGIGIGELGSHDGLESAGSGVVSD